MMRAQLVRDCPDHLETHGERVDTDRNIKERIVSQLLVD